MQAEVEQQTGTGKDLSLVHSPWTLEFDTGQGSPSARGIGQLSRLSSRTRRGGWVLSNSKLRGTLWTDKEQLAHRPPLGTETMWKW